MNMKHLRFISTSTIRPSSSEFTQRIALTPWDLQFLLLEQIQKGLLFHKPKSLSEKEPMANMIEHLKATLSRTVDIFHPLAGRLAVVENADGTSSFYLQCNGEGVQFVHAAFDGITVADILNPINVPDDVVYSFFPMNGVSNYEGISKPLLAVQVTELVDGIFIGCTMNHSVGDGSSFWHFFNTWSEISHSGLNKLSEPLPDFGRQYLDGIIDLPIRIPFFSNQIPNSKFVSPPLQQRVFRFSEEKVAQLKAKANAEMDMTDYKISSLQALMAHLWVAITRCRRLNADQEIRCFISVGLRQRMNPKLPNKYVGNAIVSRMVHTTAGELLKKGFGWAALQMKKMIDSQTSEENVKFLKGWAKNPALPKLEAIRENSLFLGSSPRFNVYGNDFGWGKPVAVRSGPAIKLDAVLNAFPAGDEDGSIEFEACLSPQTLQAMADDADFIESVTT